MRQKFFFLLAGMLVTASAGCRCANNRQASVAPQPLPFQFSDHRQNDRGGYYKEQMTITREGGHHDRSKSTHTGGNNVGGGESCPPEVNGGMVVPHQPTPSTGGVPTITTPPTMIPSPGIPVPGK